MKENLAIAGGKRTVPEGLKVGFLLLIMKNTGVKLTW